MGQPFKIDKLNVEDILSLSPMQEGMLFHYLKDPDSEQYFEQLSLSMLGKIDMVIFEKAWDFVTSKNEMLRTLFRWEKLDRPVQIILKRHNTKIFTYDFCCKEVSESIKKLCDAKIEDKNNKFDLREVPFRVTLCKLGESQYEMIVTNHHILYDGWSTGVILQDFLYAYDTLSKNKVLEKTETFRVRDSIKYLNEKNKKSEQLYWEQYLADFQGENLIQMKLEEISVRKLDQYTFDIGQDFMKEIDSFTKDKKITLAELVYCAWGILLQKYTDRRDLVFGTTVSGRNTKIKGIENAVGLFINTLPLRIENNTDKSISKLLQDVKKSVRQRELYETTSLVDIKKYSGISGKKDLFDSLVVVENYPLDNLLNKKGRLLDIIGYSIEEQTNYPLTLSINRSEHLKLTLTYDKSFMSKEYFRNMSEHFVNILRFIIKESEKSIAQINILTEREKNEILYDFNDTKADYPKDKTIQELFEEQVEKTPNNVAVVFEDKELTYKELNEKSNSLARVLRSKGIKSDSIVGLLVERSPEMIIGIMAILKAGGAYLPIDTNYPKERIKYMLKDSESHILLSTESLLDNIEFNGEIIDLLNEELFEDQLSNLEKINNPNDLIYVIYTSGTTGNPKGTIVKHQSFTNLMQWYNNEFEISEKDNVLLMASVSFDLAQKNIYAPLIVGGKLTLANKGIINYEKTNRIISENKITIINCAPSMFNPIVEFNKEANYSGLKSLKHVFLGGEPINLKKLNDWINSEECFCKIVNTYGPTECTDIATFYSLKKEEISSVPIGKPISNVKLYILDKDKNLVSVGAQGELYIAGDGLSRGYLNKSELTAEKFVENPFELGTKMYKTGDLTRWMPDGNIEFLGRIDNQVKIRGFRIELGEIENRLLQHEDIKEAAIVVKENKDNEKYICAYVVCEKEIKGLDIRGYLKEGLPEYMIPAYFVQLEEMPLTQNGKLDKKALPEPSLDATLNEYEAPTNEIEETLAKIWSEVLGLKRVGINDDFFELGGHSLKATTLVSKIHKNLNVEVPLKEIFKSSTIKGISEYIQNTEKNIYQEIKIVEEKEYYAVSSAQKRMYMLQQFDLTSTSYNMPGVLEIEGILDIERLENAFSKLIERHQTLRTSFENIEGEIVQKVNSNIDFKVDYVNIEKKVEEVALDKENLINSFVRAFDLSKAPLLRVGIVRAENAKHIMMFDMHHIISDGASMGILTKEFVELYDGNNLEEIKIQYKDFSAWQNNLLKSEKMKKQEEYWLQKYSSEIPVLNMPVDFARPSMQSFEGDSIGFKLDKELTCDLNKISKETGSTMYMMLLSGISILLSKYSGQEDLVIGSPISGRPHADLEKIIGVFVNTLAMRNRPEGSKSYKEFLMEVKENALRAYENQEYQFEELVEKLSIRRDISRNPLFDVMFTMQNMDSSEIELKNLKFKEYKNNNKIAKFDLTFTAVETSEEVSMEINYCTKLFKKETVERIVEHFKNILKTVVRNTNINLSEIEMLSEEEKNKLLYEFNDTYADYQRNKTIHSLFEEQVEKTPDNVAVVFEDKHLTYRELNEKSNSLARVLRAKGIKSDSIVGILVERSTEMIIGIMAILKAGGAYLPIDTNYPKDRIEYMLKDSESHILLSTQSLLDNIEFNGQIIDLLNKELFEGQLSNLEKINNPNDLIYVIYTSGTTGNPKGTIVKHHSFTNLMQWYDSEFKISEKDNVLLMASISFDLAQKNIYAPLIVGGKLTLANKGIVNYEKVNKVINENKITIINCAPSMFNPIMEFNKEENYAGLKSLKHVFLGGEPINVKKLNDWVNSEECFCKIVNTYGPTECTDIATFYRLKKEEISPVPIGKPINNVKLYILDKDKKLVPIGVQGELYIGGDGLSRGYLNRPELTVEKFVENPFEIGTIIYKTGDLTKWLPNGNIEFLGRVDNQVKIRGFRIELEEIENTLLKHKDIKEAAIVVKENKENEKYICAYVVCEKEVNGLNIRGYLKEGLPDYMIPAYFVQLEEMPLTQNGKLDKKALPDPSLDATLNEYEAPTNEAEEKLVEIWSEVLGVESIGINHNFFDLGGHSLKATTLVSKIHRELNVEVPLKEIFKSPTIKGISEFIQDKEKNVYEQIKIVKEKEYYEVSSAQKRMYMLQQFDLTSTSYNMPGVLEVEGKLDIERLEAAFNKLIKRHETLRTSFENIGREIVQKVSIGIDFKVDYVNIEKTVEEGVLDKKILKADNYQYEKVISEEIKKVINSFVIEFNLSKAPLLRVGVIKVCEEKHIMMFDMHHIISDGVSMGILTKEFGELYDGKNLEEIKIQYKDFSAWQNNLLKSEKMKKQEEYWLKKYSSEIPVLNMPMDFIRPSMQSFEGDSIGFKLDKELTSDLNKISKETGSTMYMTLLSGISILLSKYSGQEDLVIGSPISGRPHADLEKIIGVFVNTLTMRNRPEGNKSYKEFLMEVKENALRAYENQEYQFEELVEKLSIRRDISRNPLFDVMFTMQNMDSSEIELKNLKFKENKNSNKVAKFDLTFTAVETSEEISMDINYCTKLFKKETVERIAEHFKNILKTVVRNTNIKLSEIEMLSEEEKNKLLYEFNDTYAEYPRDKTIHQLFEEQVEKTPNNVAVVFEDKHLTYRQLNEKSNRLARNLREKGVKQDSIVAVLVDRSLAMIVAIMGILKAGGAYLPIDPEYPNDRVKYMIEDSKTNILLTKSEFVNKEIFNEVIIDLENEASYAEDVENLNNINILKDLAYVIYTSGTTGKPKGAMIEHKNVVRLMFNNRMQFDFNEKDVWTMFHSYCFDFSVWEMYGALLYGGKLILISKNKARDTLKYLNILKEEKVTVLNQIPTPFYNLMNKELECSDNELKLRYVIFGGEELKPEMVRSFMKKYPKTKTINMYGITETTVHVTFKEIREEDINLKISNIGKPIATLSTYIMDKNLKLQPIGVPGELCVGGDGVGRGYLNKRELTEAKFVTNPYKVEEKIYRSGDLARMLSNGEMEYLGRIDHQVKIRGFRIELGEIENQLLNYEAIKEVIVIDKEDKNGDKYLCAYVVCNKEVTIGKLREHLLKNLPEYMVPSYFIQLEKMPLTLNGKADRKALPEPDGNIASGTEYEAARNEVEEKLISIWSEVLDVDSIGINHNFFDLGGHSLKATTLVSRIHRELNVEVPLKEIFKSPTIKGISEFIQDKEKNVYEQIKIVKEKEYYEVSSAQKRMYMLQQFDLTSTSYNMPGVLEVEGKLDIEKLEIAFNKLIKRHETLRTSFENKEGEIIQKVSNSIDFKVDYVNIEKTIEEAVLDKEILKADNYQYEKVISEEIEKVINSFIKAFDLSKAPLLRVGVIKTSEQKHIIMFDIHHIISDGVSMGILTKEFMELYDGKELEKIKVQYKDFSAWQNNLLKLEKMKRQEEYWLKNFNGEIPVLNMPMDFTRPSMQRFEGDSINFKLDKELTRELNKVARDTGSTMYMVLLSGINILLSKYSGQEDIVIGSTIAGRPHADLEKIIGMFVNTLAMRNHPEGSKNYKDFLKQVKGNALRAYENQEYQFEELVEKLNVRRDISRNPLFDVMFTMQNMDSIEMELKDLKLKEYKNINKVAKFDLTFTAFETSQQISMDIDYCIGLFKKETIERMAEHFRNILKLIVKDANVKISELDMLSESEKNKLLYEFNDTYADYPRDKTIHQIFEEQVERTPNNIAVVFEDNELTYRELNEKSNKLARTLRGKGVKQDSIVGILVDRSLEMIVGIMGILKAGGAYLPIDPEYPEDRVKYTLEDSKTNIILTQGKLINKVAFKGTIIDLEDEVAYDQNIKNLDYINEQKDLAYIIYTSGTTGKPKGTMIDHKNVVRLMFNNRIQFDFNEKDVWTMFHSYCFDFSVWEMYGALLYGGKLVLISKNKARDTSKYLNILKEKKVTVLNQIPTPFYNLMNKELECSNNELKLRYVIFGGEALKPEMLRNFMKKYPETKTINMYGITETTVHVTFKEIREEDLNLKISNIGKPIATLSTYIMDKNLRLQPIGVPGELCVGGDGVARGYLNRRELTEAKFVANPYKIEEKIYRSGDLARMLSNGEMEYLGRIDHQVKIRGFRIELGEIENQLLNYEAIKEVIVIDKEDKNGDKYLCAYVVCDKEVTIGKLREHLLKNLPEYMVPSYFIQLEKMPLTSNGKTDRRALPEPDGNIASGTEYEGARNQVEEKMVQIWHEVLSVEKIGINDNFFELGGHSLKATSLLSKIHKELNVEVPLKEIFKSPTIKGISEYIQNTEKNIYEEIKIIEEKEYYDVSSAQKRMYISQQFDLQSTSYNMPGVLEIEGKLDVQRLESAFNKLIKRHETLRTSFENIEGEIVQKISGDIDFKVDYVNIEKTTEEVALCQEILKLNNYQHEKDMKQENKKLISDFVRVFDLSKAPLLRVGVIKVNEEKHIMMLDMHHIISDGVSMGILTKELVEFYDGKELEKIKIQYKDFSAWQNNLLKSEKMKKQEKYWLQNFSGEIPVLNMPIDFIRPSMQSFEGDSINFRLDKELTSDLNKVAKETGSTMYMVLLSGINILISKYSAQEDIIIGSPIAGRPHADLEKIIGVFVNTLTMRNHPEGSKNYKKFLKEVKENALRAYENQDYQFEELVEKLNIRRDVSRNPLFDVMFIMQNMDNKNIEINDLTFKLCNQKNMISKFDLAFIAYEVDEEVIFDIQYSTKLFIKDTIEMISVHLKNIFKAIANDKNIKLNEILLNENEFNVINEKVKGALENSTHNIEFNF